MTKEKKEKKNIHNVEIKIEGEKWNQALDDAFKKKVKNVQVDGFRKGICPRNIYEKKFGKESLFLDAADLVLQEAYDEALQEFVPVVQPSVDLHQIDENGVTFTFKIITKPDVVIKKYKDLGVKKDEINVSDEEITHEIGHLLERYTELVTKEDGAVEMGDVAIIDFEGFKDGEPFEGGKGENYSLEIGSGSFIPGFEDQLVGMKQGEEKEIKVTFPSEYPASDLAGKEVTFKVKVHEIKRKETRELDADFFDDLGMEGVQDEESLRKEIEANIKVQKEADAENQYIDHLLEEIGKNVEVDIPEEMVDEEVERLKKRFEQQLAMQGLSLDIYYQFTKSNEEDLKTQLEKEAYSNVLYRLMLEEIMNLEKIEVTEDEADKEASVLAEKYQMEKDAFLKEFGGLDMVRYDLEMRKTLELLKELNK